MALFGWIVILCIGIYFAFMALAIAFLSYAFQNRSGILTFAIFAPISLGAFYIAYEYAPFGFVWH